MTQEEKAKRYDEAIEIAKKLYGKYCINNVLESLFPELKESEDDRIRKELLEHCKNQAKPYIQTGNKCPQIQSWIAWLEKQCKQEEPQVYETKDGEVIAYSETDGYKVVEPKFKVGDWIIRSDERFKHNTYLLTEVKDYYVCEELKGRRVTFTFNDAHRNFKLWDISDAKDGDVLSNGKMIVIFKHFEDPSYRKHIVAYIGLDNSGNIQITDDTWILGIGKAKPATKEQRDLLFQKMHEAGYEWDAEKKELKKIEQKPVEENNGNLGEISSNWSEGDERIISKILGICEDFKRSFRISPASSEIVQKDIDKINNWLKSLKDRVQPKQEWSEEDERNLQGIIDEIEANKNNAPDYDLATYDRFLSWLKSIKQRIGE